MEKSNGMFDEISNHLPRILCCSTPTARAELSGSSSYPQISGMVYFYSTPYNGIMIEAEVFNLPTLMNAEGNAKPEFFGFHIHQKGDCSADFVNTGDHYNPDEAQHPHHAGDLPPLIAGGGYAWMSYFAAGLNVPALLDRSVVIHAKPDDFTTQPSGDSGDKIACGVIEPFV